MTTPDPNLDYQVAWRSLPRRERNELTQSAMRGQRAVNRWDAAITLWWTQRELQRGLRNSILAAVGVVIGLFVFAWATTGVLPTTFAEVFEVAPLLPVFLLIPVAADSLRRPRLKRSAQLNAAVLTGKKFDGPPDPEEAERLLARARKEGWFRGTRPQQP